MSTIRVNITKMFAYHNPWDCSNSIANMGANAGRITWDNAMLVARDVTEWLPDTDTNEPIACEEIRSWAKETGAWDAEEREGWTETECLALIVQNVASDLMNAGFEGEPDCAEDLTAFAEHEASYIMHMEIVDGDVFAHLYFGG